MLVLALIVFGVLFVSRQRFWGLATAWSLCVGIIAYGAGTRGELSSYSGLWFVFMWSIVVGIACLAIWMVSRLTIR